MIKNQLLILFLGLIAITGCEVIDRESTAPIGIVEGVKPIYAAKEGWDVIQTKAPQPIQHLGKIYYKDPYIYVNERNQGVHILDNTNPFAPVPIKFIKISGNEDIAIKGDILYVDNITDLVSINISDLENIEVTSRVKDLYQESKKAFPDGYNGYFECVDDSKGIVIGWEKAQLENPTCFR